MKTEEFIMLVSAEEMLTKAKAGKYAVGQFNINNLEWTKSILLTAEELKSPVILGVSEGAGKYMTGYKTVVGMVNGMMEELGITVPVALHLDHGSYEGCLKCVEAGFSSIMFDGSHYPIEENIEKTKEIVELCHSKGVSVEAEVGSIGGEEDGVISAKQRKNTSELQKMLIDAAHLPTVTQNDIIVTNVRHYEALNKALEAIHRVQNGLDSQISGDFLSQDIRECIFFISDIAGEVTNDMVLQNIFQHFCIGK